MTLLFDTIDGPGSHVTDHDWSFPYDIMRLCPEGNDLRLTVEVLIADDEPRYYGQICEQVNLSNGLAIQADSVIMFTDAEMSAIQTSTELAEYRDECHAQQMEDEAERAEMERDFIREGGALLGR